ncbi:MAG: type II toxin-antitoxin system VapC family toxin [Isosphaeraceae bacterium]
MNLLDTDVVSHVQKTDPVGTSIVVAMAAFPNSDFRITTVTAYEMVNGAIGLIHDLRRNRKDLIPGFQLFQELLDYLGLWAGRILPYDAASERIYRGFPSRLRQELGNDARIAAIALTHGAGVWTCNASDYMRVPGLTVYAAESGSRVI